MDFSNKNQTTNNYSEMDVDQILKKYGLTRETATKYIDAITRLNQTQAAEETGVSGDTINRYKQAFQQMTPTERLLLTTSLAQDKLLDQVSEK